MRRAAVARRIDVFAAGRISPSTPFRASTFPIGSITRTSPSTMGFGLHDGLSFLSSDSDERHNWFETSRVLYMRTGTSIPMRSSVRVSCWRT